MYFLTGIETAVRRVIQSIRNRGQRDRHRRVPEYEVSRKALMRMSKPEIVEWARTRGIDIPSKMKKELMIQEIGRHVDLDESA